MGSLPHTLNACTHARKQVRVRTHTQTEMFTEYLITHTS